MAIKLSRGKNLPIGVDIGTSSIKLAQLRQIDEQYELVAAQSEQIPHSLRKNLAQRQDFLAESIRQMMKSKDFRGQQAILSLPAAETFVHHLKLLPLPSDEMPRVIRAELQGKLPYDVNDAIIRHVVAGELSGDAESKNEVIAVCAQRSVVESYLAMSQKARLDVVGIDIEPCALVECFSRLVRRTADANRTILYIDMGAESTQVVFSHGNRIVFARNLKIGGVDLDQAVAEGMQMPEEQASSLRMDLLRDEEDEGARNEVFRLLTRPIGALGNELNTCLRYYESIFRSRSIERVIFLGGQAFDKRLCQVLAQRLNLPAQIGDPLLRIKRAGDAGIGEGLNYLEPQPNWAVAVGLSLGAVRAA